MALKPNIYESIQGLSIPKKVAREFKDLIDIKRLENNEFTLIAFPAMKGETSSIANFKTIKKALNKIKNKENKVVAVAHNFTDEATDILDEIEAIVFSKRDFFWSDASLKRIKE
jgi:hypothetical protein